MGPDSSEILTLARKVRRLKRLVAGALLVMVAMAALALTSMARNDVRDRIEAREIAVRDADGTVRARLDTSGLSLYDGAGQERIQALLIDGTASLILYGREQHRIVLAAADDGHLGAYFFDNRIRDRARLSVNTEGDVGLTLFDDNYVWRATMAVSSNNEPSLTIFDKLGHVVSRLPPDAAPTAAPSPGSR